MKEKIKEIEVAEFLKEILEVCKKHGFSLAHEDTQGAFIVENYKDEDSTWLMYALNRVKGSTKGKKND